MRVCVFAVQKSSKRGENKKKKWPRFFFFSSLLWPLLRYAHTHIVYAHTYVQTQVHRPRDESPSAEGKSPPFPWTSRASRQNPGKDGKNRLQPPPPRVHLGNVTCCSRRCSECVCGISPMTTCLSCTTALLSLSGRRGAKGMDYDGQ